MKIFSDKRYLPAGIPHCEMLFPFWGENALDPREPRNGYIDRYTEIGSQFFQMTAMNEADIVILPMDWLFALKNEKAMNLTKQLVSEAQKAGKQVVIFFLSDSVEEVPIENAVVFRTSSYGSEKKPNEFALSAWNEDFKKKYFGGRLPIRQKSAKPVIGFCGYSAPLKTSFKRRVRNFLRWGAYFMKIGNIKIAPSKTGLKIRAKALRNLSRSNLVTTNFIIRDSFLGGTILPDGSEDFIMKQKVRSEYVQNMAESDYILCARGTGNFSYRFYEALSCGRIPVFIDTDCVLPYDFEINWKDYCVWVDESELPLVAEKVSEFHNNLSPSDFIKFQQKCRNLWEKWLSPEGFFSNFYRHFQKIKIKP